MRIMDDAMAVEAGNWVVATAWFSEHAARIALRGRQLRGSP
jgi:hypothetical protein